MCSPARIFANRQNAALSTGPSTPAGKAASSKNATRHGLSGAFTVLAHESHDDFEQLAQRIRAEFEPATDAEHFLVDQMIHARWRIIRIQRLEAQAFDEILTEPGSAADPDSRILAALTTSGNVLEKLNRYSAAAERCYFKSLRELQSSRLRSGRTEAQMLDNYLDKVVFAPMPTAAGAPLQAFRAPVQNEAKLALATHAHASAHAHSASAEYSNPALRL